MKATNRSIVPRPTTTQTGAWEPRAPYIPVPQPRLLGSQPIETWPEKYRLTIAIGLLFFAAMTSAQASQPMTAGQVNYMLQCQGCHKANGAGFGESVPDLRIVGRQLLAVPAGRQFYVSVPGSSNAPLSNQQLAEVLNFIIADILGDKDDQADSLSRFTEEEIARYRSIKIPDVKGLREELVRSVAENSLVKQQGGTGDQ